jgi:UTP:GlnB (protein PII) uridylyltransferase
VDKSTISRIEPFLSRLKEEFAPQKVLLFGSKARGEDWKRSDCDFIIASEKVRGMHWLERISRIARLWDLLFDLDVLPYTLEEFADKSVNSSTVRSALRECKTLVG